MAEARRSPAKAALRFRELAVFGKPAQVVAAAKREDPNGDWYEGDVDQIREVLRDWASDLDGGPRGRHLPPDALS